ncbi:phosphonate ABC transporter, permease protein PhnE [Devosia sp.]|uniref:phosphonate ABC transporter, permease protein PhnE n=1 Tax=Devosia sp. TaxID=1871048 RepID=UPI003262D08D
MTLATEPSEAVRTVDLAWRQLAGQRRLYSILGFGGLALALVASLWFADESNAGHFWDRLPHLFDFLSWLIPHDWNDVWRALLDLPSPADNGTQEFNFPVGKVEIGGGFYIPEYFYLMLITINVALVSTIIGFTGGLALCFFAARNLMPYAPVRFFVRRTMEILRAFPEIVIAGLFAAVLSIGPVAAMVAVGLHTIGALGKLYFEVIENIDMKPDEGIRAVGGNWIERVRFGALPQVLPNFVSYAMLRLEINVRASTIIGAVGGGGIGEELKLSISRGFGAKTVALIALLLTTIIIVDQISAHIRRRLIGDAAFLVHG